MYDALDASGIKRMEEMSARQNTIDEFSDEHENLGMLFADSQALPFDTEGRIILPENLAEYAHITESAAFVGLGKSFQIWEPTRFADHQAMLRERARRQGTRLPPSGGANDRAAVASAFAGITGRRARGGRACGTRSGASRRCARYVGAACRCRLCRRHVWRRRLQRGGAHRGALPRLRHRS